MTELNHNPSRGRFRVIVGGPAAPASEAEQMPRSKKARPKGVVTEVSDGSPIEQERLRRAVLALQLEHCGITVEQALDELSERWEEEGRAAGCRTAFLDNRLGDLGLLVHTVNPDLELARNCFASLYAPFKLLVKHPELATLEPRKHQYLEIG